MQHSSLENGRWAELTFPQQMANIGSEASRVYRSLLAGKEQRAESAFVRFQELIDLTIRMGRHYESPSARSAMWEELLRFRELYCSAYLSHDIPELAALGRYLDQFAKIGRPSGREHLLVY